MRLSADCCLRLPQGAQWRFAEDGSLQANAGPVDYIAAVTETSILCEITMSGEFSQTFDDTIYYLSALDYAESSVLQPGQTTFPYFLNVNSTQTFNFAGNVSVSTAQNHWNRKHNHDAPATEFLISESTGAWRIRLGLA